MRKKILYIFVLLLLITRCNLSFSQNTYTLNINYTSENKALNSIKYQTNHIDSNSVYNELDVFLKQCIDLSYIEAYYKTVEFDSNKVVADLEIGEKWYFGNISSDSIDNIALKQSKVRNIKLSNESFNFSNITYIQNKLIYYYENNGYPFAKCYLEEINLDSNSFEANIIIEKGQYFTIDSIIIKGDAKISNDYLSKYLGIKNGDAYNEQKIASLDKNLKEIAFIKLIKSSEIVFTNQNASIYIYANKVNASSFDGYIGVLPSDVTNKSVALSGEVKFNLNNSFGKGEKIYFEWKSLVSSNQNLNISFSYPYIFKLPFGLDSDFDLYKKDSSWLNVGGNFGLQFLFKSANYVSAYFRYESSSLLETDKYANSLVLPNELDYKSQLLGLKFHWIDLDYIYNPRKGIYIDINTLFGQKAISINPSINKELYDDIKLNDIQLNAKFYMQAFIPIFKRSSILSSIQSATIYSNSILENEQFRLGGINNIRGFDQESIKASSYILLNFEYRFLFAPESNLKLFWNGAWYESNTIGEYNNDYPWGFGAGVSFNTSAGVFNFIYALGSQNSNPIDFKSSKIHFGYSNVF